MRQTKKEAFETLVDEAESVNRALHTSGAITFGALSSIKASLETSLQCIADIQGYMLDEHKERGIRRFITHPGGKTK